jgi:hypothetical protein
MCLHLNISPTYLHTFILTWLWSSGLWCYEVATSTLKMEAICSSEKFAATYETTQLHNLDDRNPCLHHCESLESLIYSDLFSWLFLNCKMKISLLLQWSATTLKWICMATQEFCYYHSLRLFLCVKN